MDLISRQAAIDTLAEWNDEAINNRLNNLPSVDSVPIVRCKDCKYRRYDSMDGSFYCGGAFGGIETEADFFCKDGEQNG